MLGYCCGLLVFIQLARLLDRKDGVLNNKVD